MKFKTLLCAAALATSAAGALADDLNLNVALVPNASLPGAFSTAWGVTHLEAGAFTDTFNFAAGVGGWVSASLVSIGFIDSTDIDFTSVMLNDETFDLSGAGAVELATLDLTEVSAPMVITVMGIAAPTLSAGSPIAASYSGTANISPVPELQTWALLFAGLGMVGMVAHRRRPR